MLIPLALPGFALAAIAYLGFALLLGIKGAPSGTGRLFLVAVSVEAMWATTVAAAMAGLPVPVLLVSLAEAARLFFWILFLLSLLRAMGAGDASAPDSAQRAASGGMVAAATIAAGAVAVELFAFGERPAFIVHVIGAVFALVCLEQVYRNTGPDGRWALKFLAIGLLALFGFDLFMYSEALLFSRMNPALWSVRGYANALLVPLLGIAAARNDQWKTGITVSRQVVFHSATLFAAGLFLMLMAVGGYLLRWFGGDWGEAAQALFVFITVVALMVALFSGSLRARLRVLLAKHFFRYRYDYRAEWLRLTELLSEAPAGSVPGQTSRSAPQPPAASPQGRPGRNAETPPPQGSELLEIRALQGLARLVESPGAALWLSGDDGAYVCNARWVFHAETPVVPGADPLAAFLRSTQWVVSLPEWREHPQRYDGLALPAQIASEQQNWLIVPLMLHDQLLGFALLAKPLVPVTVDWEVRDALKAAARQVASYLAVRRAVESLVQARQFDSFNRMSAFVVHDLKNLVAQLTLLMANAARHRDNPEFQQDMLDTVENVLGRMQGLLMQLRAGARPIEPPGPVPLVAALEVALRSRRGSGPEPTLEVAPELQHAAVLAHRDRLERVIGHLVQNAAEATPPDGRISMRVQREGSNARIEVEDTGKGMSERFIREQLFKPFESTKDHGMGIGAFESRDYVRELGGSLEVESSEGAGSLFRIRLPLALATANG
ncbi:XrtA/PEP-CTERM system histidine kinase PrsK [Quisquiliibacterium transsilvanicum]|uniref:histidine kinase n=1 Tax=Quisquiliibacterium transsilvanicum TaxID=1549638 RepID=A0A7W8HF01_9BURK|nr:XrtA/PEP-CTERM system histidine kinase PrsK [Quisquiliibacterium transsilvanicum]MBB5270068.1 signal transduction histidine kinase [Quisquiliibacterium transsilvanicum]